MRYPIILGLAVAMAGCATSYQRAPLTDDVTYQPWGEYEAIKTVRFASVSGGNLAVCTAQSVTNDAVFAGTPNLMSAGVMLAQAPAGETMLHSDGDSVVARGTTGYSAGNGLFWTVRYTLTADQNGYLFSNLSQAVTANGYMPVGGWKEAGAEQAVNALREIASSIDRCRT